MIDKNTLPDAIYEILNLSNGIYLAGGSIRDYYIGEIPKDYDFYFKSNDDFNNALNYILSIGGKCYNSKFYTMSFNVNCIDVQFVFRDFFESLDLVYSHFDFINVMASARINADKIEVSCDHNFYYCNNIREVEINTITHALKSFERLKPYMKKGFNVDNAYNYLIELFKERRGDKRALMLSDYY